MTQQFDVDYHNTNVSPGDKVRLIKTQRYYTSTPHWSGDDGPKVGDQVFSYGFVVLDEPYKSGGDYQDTNCVISSWDEGGFVVEKTERLNYDSLRVRVRPANEK